MQQVIVYNDGHRRRVYDTAYDGDQQARAVKRCVARFGTFANVRVLPADIAARRGITNPTAPPL